MTVVLLFGTYIIGIFVWVMIERKYNSYEDCESINEFEFAHEVNEEMHDDGSILRSILWPLMLVIMLVLSPFVAFRKLFDILK